MKSFAILAIAGAAAAQNLGSCAQLCINNMATIANQQFQCGAGDVSCFCTKSNWAYGVRDCSRQACSADESAQAIAWASSQCGGVAQSAASPPAAIPILTSALVSATNAAPSAVASVTGAIGSAASSGASAASSAASGALASASSAASGVVASASSAASGALASASSAASGALASASSAAGSAASSASGALNSALSSGASRASSAAGSATSGAPASGVAPKMTGIPMAAGAGLAALFFL